MGEFRNVGTIRKWGINTARKSKRPRGAPETGGGECIHWFNKYLSSDLNSDIVLYTMEGKNIPALEW